MDEHELRQKAKQADDLEESIIRLCNEADSYDIVLNALISSIVTFSEAIGISPIEILKVLVFYIHARASNSERDRIIDYLSGKELLLSTIGKRKPIKKKK